MVCLMRLLPAVIAVGILVALLSCGGGRGVGGLISPLRASDIDDVSGTDRPGGGAPVVKLIEHLDSDDSAVRVFAITQLRSLAGTTLGYQFDGRVAERRAAVARWVEWYHSRPWNRPEKSRVAPE